MSTFNLPIGSICIFPGDTIPPGWLLCNGSTISTSDIPTKAFQSLAIALGVDKNISAISIPDLRNSFVVGAGGTYEPGKSGGPTNHSHKLAKQNKTFKTSSDGAHHHKYPSAWYNNNTSTGTGRTSITQTGHNWNTNTADNHSHKATVIVPEFSTQSVEIKSNTYLNRPKYIALNYIIKIKEGSF